MQIYLRKKKRMASSPNSFDVVKELTSSGRDLLILQDFSNALKIFLKAYDILSKNTNDHIDLVNLFHYIAECHWRMGNEHQAAMFQLKENEMRTRLWYNQDNYDLTQSLDKLEINAKKMGEFSFEF